MSEPKIVEITSDEETETVKVDQIEEIIDEPVEPKLTEQERKKLKKKAYKQRKKAKKQVNESVKDENLSLEEQAVNKLGKENLEKWEAMCNMVKDYRKKLGSFPSMRSNSREVNDEAAKVLARWLWLQKVSYAKGNMHPYHSRRLEEIGFKF
jgi:hypothetical protein